MKNPFTPCLPEKPKKQSDQIDMLWSACFNHIPTKLNWIDIEIKFLMFLVTVTIALSFIN